MKIVDFNTFIDLPEGTLYAHTDNTWISGLMIKSDTCGNKQDWFYYNLEDSPSHEYNGEFIQYDEIYDKLLAGESIPYEPTLERDGMFDYDRNFIIYEKEDIKELISLLKETLNE